MKKYVCDVCGWVYDPAVGDPDNGVAPGTAFEDIPDDWVCPLCGVGKGYVVDYVKFNFGPKWLRGIIFNISDFCIFIGAFLSVVGSEVSS